MEVVTAEGKVPSACSCGADHWLKIKEERADGESDTTVR